MSLMRLQASTRTNSAAVPSSSSHGRRRSAIRRLPRDRWLEGRHRSHPANQRLLRLLCDCATSPSSSRLYPRYRGLPSDLDRTLRATKAKRGFTRPDANLVGHDEAVLTLTSELLIEDGSL